MNRHVVASRGVRFHELSTLSGTPIESESPLYREIAGFVTEMGADGEAYVRLMMRAKPGRLYTADSGDLELADIATWTIVGYDQSQKTQYPSGPRNDETARVDVDALAALGAQSRSSLWEDCGPYSRTLSVINVKSFVNLRTGPGFDKAIRLEIPLGDAIEFTGEFRVSGSINLNLCRDLCTSAQQSNNSHEDQRLLNGYYENNVFWYEVRTPNGEIGWISGRFLDYAR